MFLYETRGSCNNTLKKLVVGDLKLVIEIGKLRLVATTNYSLIPIFHNYFSFSTTAVRERRGLITNFKIFIIIVKRQSFFEKGWFYDLFLISRKRVFATFQRTNRLEKSIGTMNLKTMPEAIMIEKRSMPIN